MTQRQRKIWESMLAQSFQPHQWFMDHDRPEPDLVVEEKQMWVYRHVGSDYPWAVGYYSPDKAWHEDERFTTIEAARERVHWLNGGNSDA